MSLIPVAEGLLATSLVAFTVASWIAAGTVLLPGLRDDDEAATPVALLIGSGATATGLGLFALAGWVEEGVILAALLLAAALWRRRRRVRAILTHDARSLRSLGESKVLSVALGAALALMWTAAIAPPRSADAMRYHLAHIRLIIAEGRWVPISDFHFALPFGWTLSYLPFELLGLPQGSQLLSLSLGVMTTASVVRLLKRVGAHRVAVGAALLMLIHPFVLRSFTEAGSDQYAILVVAAATVLLVRAPGLSPTEAAAFGFVAWIGSQSRYQLVAVGIAASAVFLFATRRCERRGSLWRNAAMGAAGALVLASPFYLTNVAWFGNPVWPLMIAPPGETSAYSDVVAWHYGKSLTGSHTFRELAGGIFGLVTWPRLFPLAIAILVSVTAAAFSRDPTARKAGAFGLAFLALWMVMQPTMYPKFVLLLLPAGAVCAGVLLTRRTRVSKSSLRGIQAAAVALVAITAALSVASLRYAVTGDRAGFHRTTWFYPVFNWLNARANPDAKVLAIVSSGMTYYLDRPYRRADPWIGGEVDWLRVRDAAALAQVLDSGGYQYIVYEDRDWGLYEGGPEMKATVHDAVGAGVITPVRQFDVQLYASRATGRHRTARVIIYRVSSANAN